MAKTYNSNLKKSVWIPNNTLASSSEPAHYFTNLMSETTKYFKKKENSNYAEWINNLSTEQLDAIESYTGSGYVSMNSYLYQNNIDNPVTVSSKYTVNNIKNLEAALNKSEIKKSIIVRRGAGYNFFYGANLTSLPTLNELKNFEGKVIHNNAFLSSSAASKAAFDNKPVEYVIKIPPSKGAGAWVAQKSQYEKEKEFLINNKGFFKVNKISPGTGGYWYTVEMEWIGRSKKQIFK